MVISTTYINLYFSLFIMTMIGTYGNVMDSNGSVTRAQVSGMFRIREFPYPAAFLKGLFGRTMKVFVRSFVNDLCCYFLQLIAIQWSQMILKLSQHDAGIILYNGFKVISKLSPKCPNMVPTYSNKIPKYSNEYQKLIPKLSQRDPKMISK